MNNNDELNEMRIQISILKNTLDKEKLVNRELLRSVIGTKLKSITTDRIIQTVLLVIMIPFIGYMLPVKSDLSTPLFIATELLLLFGLWFILYSHRGISSSAIINGNLVEVGRRLARLKILNSRYIKFSFPLIVLWWLWFITECAVKYGHILGYIFCIAVGLIVLFPWTLYSWRKRQRLIDELKGQIDALTNV